METNREITDEEILNQLKKLPDFDRLPLPKSWYERFHLSPPKIPTMREALKMHYETQLAYLNSPTSPEVEIRPPADGGVRPLLDAEVPEMKILHGKTLQELDLSGNLIEDGQAPVSEESK